MCPAEPAVLLGFHPVGMGFFVLGGVVVALLAFLASQSDPRPHSLLLLENKAQKKEFYLLCFTNLTYKMGEVKGKMRKTEKIYSVIVL
jgi:hypothetical protein